MTETTFFLSWDFGGCNDGSHTTGLQQFQTQEEAEAEGERLKARNLGDGGYVVIEGRIVHRSAN